MFGWLLLVVACVWAPAMIYMGFVDGRAWAVSNYLAYPRSFQAFWWAAVGFVLGFVMGLVSGLAAPALYKEWLQSKFKWLRRKPTASNNE